jgi:hypothetical protein
MRDALDSFTYEQVDNLNQNLWKNQNTIYK